MSDSETPDVLTPLRRGPVGLSSPEEVQRARAVMVPWLEQQVALLPQQRAAYGAQRRRRRVLFGGAGALAAAASAVLVLLPAGAPPVEGAAQSDSPKPAIVVAASDGYATLVSGKVMSGSVDVLAGSRLGLSSRVETGKEEGATLRASGGYELSLSTQSEVAFLPLRGKSGAEHRELRLYRGVVELSVSPLPQGSTFSVLTDDAKVTVVGTKFSVEAHAGDGTCVRVTEGKVKVERGAAQRMLGAGDSWGCKPETEPSSVVSEAAAPAAAKRSATTLQQESQLLSAGISRERQGRPAAARRAYEELLRKYPRSAFAQDARAGLARLKGAAAE